jgi:hypothetical protein
LLLITAFSTVVGGLLVTTNTANAVETYSTTSETNTLIATDMNDNATAPPLGDLGSILMSDQGFGGGCRRGGGPGRHEHGFMGGFGNIEISSEYTANVNAILNNDADVQNLISQGYNVTSINPMVKSVVEADGTLTTKATTAIVTLQNGTSGYATVSVDVSQGKVAQIVIITRTVIDKTTS